VTLKQAIQEAIRERDPSKAIGVADFCRFRLGKNYAQTYQLVRGVCPDVTAPDWETLLYEGDV